ncbi:conserved exported hypothetical protein [Roseovarius sp. EC-HK134]|uniref:hypothetical protein n=1 Tax=unclassified Roseovarius TaxID=2614913 RepID=UPI001250FDAB|nr:MULTISPECIES: hypothetical protein [unclassified Roseovarius]VVT28949.1 conserved exported hypothetical protein [Roseovarius sp. EC-HK134]VVT30049.1 conserved exported hypothetical protein [Roseovarius sp. EC-SD190]
MRLKFSAACIVALACASGAMAETNVPVFGKWDCEIMHFSLDGSTYVVSGQKINVKSVEKIADDAWGAEMTDGYRFAMFDVTADSLIWHSPASGDTFECKRLND